MKILYHANCSDGFGAAYLSYCWAVGQGVPGIDFVPCQYGHPPPSLAGGHAEIVDFSYDRETMLRLKAECPTLSVIDHHKTAQAALEGLDFCKFDMTRSACKIVADECGFRGEWVDYIQDRDLWTKALPHCDEVAAWIRTVPHNVEDWERDVVNTPIQAMIERGTAIRRYQQTLVADALTKAHEIDLGGHKILAVNYTAEYSEIAGELSKGRPFGAVYFDAATHRVWSLRSTPEGIDVAEFAKSRGGGGHKHAAGFQELL